MTIFSVTCYFSVTWMDNVICHRILQTQCIWRSFKCSYRHLKMRKSVGKTKIGFTLYLTIFKYGSSRPNMCGCVQTPPQMQLLCSLPCFIPMQAPADCLRSRILKE